MTIAALVALAAASLLSGCARTPDGPPLMELRYELGWRARGTSDAPDADGGVWQVTNDLGYRVRVERGYVVSRSMELVECPHEARATGTALAWLVGALGPGLAHAGHSSLQPNPAAITTPQIESLTAPRRLVAGRVAVLPQAFCRAHYLVARAERDARGLPADVDMVGKSLRLEGSYLAPGASDPVAFRVATSIANGALVDLTAAGAPPALGSRTHGADAGVVRVTIERDRAHLFDGVAFASTSEQDVARRVLANLIAHTRIAVAGRRG